MAELLKNEEQAQVIGILGPWGSGKSTAVKQIENAVLADDPKKTHFFTYDAWLHQADPVRRSFLEALVKFLVSKNRAGHEEWEKKLQELNSSVEKTESETAPVLSHSGKWLIASLALVPLGLSLVGYDALKDAVATPPSTWAASLLLTGIVLCLAPAITALGLYVAWRPWANPFSKKLWESIWSSEFWIRHRKPHEKESIFGILSNRMVDRTLNVSVRQPEPTSIEFQKRFRELMKGAAKDGHRFVFVIDNLDRISEAEALQVWGTIKGFFLGPADEGETSRPWYLPSIILPLDPKIYSQDVRAGTRR